MKMKKFLTIVVQALVSLCCGLLMAIVAIKVSDYEYAPMAGLFFGCLMGAMATGMLDAFGKRARHTSMKDNRYDRAA